MNLLATLAQALDKVQLPYMIIGGQAVLVYGEPRLTRDVDVTLGTTPDDLDRVLRAAGEVNLHLLVDDPPAFVRQTWVLPTLDEDSGLRVDFIFSWTPYEQQALKRARAILVEGYPVRFASPEDLIIHKILAARPRDLEDVRSVLRKQALDAGYVRRWLKQFEEVVNRPVVTLFESLWQEENDDL